MARQEARIRRLLAGCADEGLRGHGDLWPRIQAQARAGRPLRRRAVYRMTAATLLLLAVLASVPTVRVAVGGTAERVRLALAGPSGRPQVTILKTTLPAPEPATPAAVPLMSSAGLEELRQQVPFPLRIPARLPGGLAPTGGEVRRDAGVLQTVIEYRPAGTPAGPAPLRQWISDTALPSPPLPPLAERTPIDVYGRAAGWVRTEDALWLIWPEDGLNYALEARGPGLDLDDLVAMASALE